MRWLLAVGVLALAAVLAPSGLAGKPALERFDIDESFADPDLTAECGVPVTVHVKGHVIVRSFSGGGVLELRTLNVAVTATAGDNSYRFRDVGADLVQVKQDGTEILLIIGQIPFAFTGVLKIDLVAGEAILEPAHDISGRLDDACAALTA